LSNFLGRRIRYDFDKFGDSPACLGDPRRDLAGLNATSEGYGYTEHGNRSDVLLTANVTIISNQLCSEILQANTSRNLGLKLKVQSKQSLLCVMQGNIPT